MKVSMRTDYGVRAAVELAASYGRPPVTSADIAARQDIPEPYLDQLLVALRKAGIVRSSRGPLGGHALARDPRDTTMADLVEALEGHGPPVTCFDDEGKCQLNDCCPQKEIWIAIDEAVWNILRGTSLAELVARQTQLESRAMYHI